MDLSSTCEQVDMDVRLDVKAQPGARANRLAGVHDGALRVQITAAPEKGKANRALRKLLASVIGATLKDVELISGEHAARKTFLLHHRSLEHVLERLQSRLK